LRKSAIAILKTFLKKREKKIKVYKYSPIRSCFEGIQFTVESKPITLDNPFLKRRKSFHDLDILINNATLFYASLKKKHALKSTFFKILSLFFAILFKCKTPKPSLGHKSTNDSRGSRSIDIWISFFPELFQDIILR